MASQIDYDALTQTAMRTIVRAVLKQTAQHPMPPDEHHFYITFKTKTPGVIIPDHLAEKFPDTMTIVIQHQYRDLTVHDQHFGIVLKFNHVPHHLTIPYRAISNFIDPSVNFKLTLKPDMDIQPHPENTSQSRQSDTETPADEQATASDNTVISLDMFRRK